MQNNGDVLAPASITTETDFNTKSGVVKLKDWWIWQNGSNNFEVKSKDGKFLIMKNNGDVTVPADMSITGANLQIKDWWIWQSGDELVTESNGIRSSVMKKNGEVEFKKNISIEGDTIRLKNWLLWQNADGNLEFKNKDTQKYFILKADGGKGGNF
jgi:hypothetical protein